MASALDNSQERLNFINDLIIIYAVLPQYQNVRDYMSDFDWCASKISQIEVLGYHKITVSEKELYHQLFTKIHLYDIDDNIIQKATEFRQTKKMSLGDAIILATAVIYKIPLMTRNSKDFDWIDDLTLINPFDAL